MTPHEVLASTTDDVRLVIEEILAIEQTNRHIQNINSNKVREAQIAEAILDVIYKKADK